LPQNLSEIDSEAFAGIDAQVVIIPHSCKLIGANAFANCQNLRVVVMDQFEVDYDATSFPFGQIVIVPYQ
jgi:hypothetical protein